MTRRALKRHGALLLLLLAGCGGDSTGPTTGSLAVTVAGLPGGTAAEVHVAGPGGFARDVSATETLSGLTPGSYTVTAGPVTAGSVVYAGSPGTQTVTVSEVTTPTQAAVTYAVSSGNLAVTIAGLPGGTAASVTVAGPGGFSQALTASQTFASVAPGSYTVTAEAVTSGAAQYSPSPATQQVTVSTGGTAAATVTYNDDGAAGLNYRIDGVYLTQGIQTYAGSVPLVANRDGYLRVFVTASEAGAVSPDVRVRFYHDGTQVQEQIITHAGLAPTAPQEGTLSSSWNVAVPKTLIKSGLSLRVEVDPANLLPETNESDNAFPGSGLPLTPEVRTAGVFRVTFVPVQTTVNGRLGNVTAGNKDQFLATAMKMHPLSSFDAAVGATLTTSAPALQSGNGNQAWNTILGEIDTRRTADGSSRYYMGIVNPPYSGGVAGIGYIGYPVAVGWDKLPSGASVAAHEWGHNWGRQHAPCGNPGGEDQAYPYSGGIIGVYGFDVATATLKPTSAHDLMGYCDEEWISDYTYRGVIQFRGAEAGVSTALGEAVQPVLVVWGRIEGDRVVLEPAFQAVARPALPASGGPYQLEARAADGSRMFAVRFAPREVADDAAGVRQFTLAIPLSAERAGRIARLRVEGGGRSAEVAAVAGQAPSVSVRRSGPGRVALDWDAARAPMVVVRDPRSGQILSFARGGRAEILTDAAELALSLSDRLRSREARVRVEER